MKPKKSSAKRSRAALARASIAREGGGALEHLHLDAPAGVAIALEDVANLAHHRLRREGVVARPARHRAHLPERADLPRGAVGDDDVRGAVYPQDRRLLGDRDDPRPVAVLR